MRKSSHQETENNKEETLIAEFRRSWENLKLTMAKLKDDVSWCTTLKSVHIKESWEEFIIVVRERLSIAVESEYESWTEREWDCVERLVSQTLHNGEKIQLDSSAEQFPLKYEGVRRMMQLI